MKAIDAVRRWWQGRHPVLPISHYEPPRPVGKGKGRSATKAPFSRTRRRERNRARERSQAAGQHPSYPSRR